MYMCAEHRTLDKLRSNNSVFAVKDSIKYSLVELLLLEISHALIEYSVEFVC